LWLYRITMKKLLFCLILVLSSFSSAREAVLQPLTYLQEVVIVGQPIEAEIYSLLINGKDSVLVRNGHDSLYVQIKPVHYTLAKILLAQAYVESGENLASPLATTHNNFYAITFPGRGKLTTALHGRAWAEGRTGYCSYASPEESAADLILWLDFHKFPHGRTTPELYVHFIKKHKYFESAEAAYLTNLKKHLLHGHQQHNLLQESI